MILQELAAYYDRKREADPGALPEHGFEPKELPFIVVLTPDGDFVDLEDTREGEGRARRGRVFIVPQGEKRTSGIRAYLLWDNIGYVFGVVTKGKRKERVAEQHAAFVERLEQTFGERPEDEGVGAVLRFLKRGEFEDVFSHPLWAEVLSTPGANVSFRLAGAQELVLERDPVRDAVREGVQSHDAPTGQCLVTGATGPIAVLHPHIKGVRGAQSTGASIVSFNLDAFRTHGREQGVNAPVSERAAFAYTAALNRLLARDSRLKTHVGDATVVFWAERDNPIEDLAAALFGDDEEWLDDPDRGVEHLRTVFSAPWKGQPPLREDRSRFFVLGLAPNASRVAIRFWRPTTVSDFAAAVLQHFDDVSVARPEWAARHPSIRNLLRSTAVLRRDDNLPPNLAGATLDAIVTGRPYPRSLFLAAVRRARAERDVSPDRAAVIKGFLVRDYRQNPNDSTEVHVSLDPSNRNAGYVLGRLFAALERAQEIALPGIGKGIREIYYGGASATPVAVFPTLLKLKNYHLAKIESRGAAVNLERLIGEVMDNLEGFPPMLSLPDQGRFALGYYHQRQAFFRKAETSDPEASDA